VFTSAWRQTSAPGNNWGRHPVALRNTHYTDVAKASSPWCSANGRCAPWCGVHLPGTAAVAARARRPPLDYRKRPRKGTLSHVPVTNIAKTHHLNRSIDSSLDRHISYNVHLSKRTLAMLLFFYRVSFPVSYLHRSSLPRLVFCTSTGRLSYHFLVRICIRNNDNNKTASGFRSPSLALLRFVQANEGQLAVKVWRDERVIR